ncbi:MAG: C40 family peptidase [Oscillospiraceae bacterium]
MISKHLKTIAAASALIGVLTVSANAAGIVETVIPSGTQDFFSVPENLSSILRQPTDALNTSNGAEKSNTLLVLSDSEPPDLIFLNLIELGDDNSFVSESEGQKIADTAMKYLGTPYVWGGTNERGFDCSGFVQYVYKECGYTIDRTAAQIYKNGTYIEKENLEIGDAICFSSHTESIGHVGIYIGNGQFIHASSGSGSVIISDLSEKYYAARYVGARHIVL